jgi:hypothetical protein
MRIADAAGLCKGCSGIRIGFKHLKKLSNFAEGLGKVQ